MEEGEEEALEKETHGGHGLNSDWSLWLSVCVTPSFDGASAGLRRSSPMASSAVKCED